MAVGATSSGGLDVESLVSQLMAIEKKPLTAIDKKIATKSANAEYLSGFKTKAMSFEASIAALRDSTRFAGTATTSSDASAVTATSSNGASVADIDVKVVKTAQAHRVAFTGFSSTSEQPGSGQFSLSIGGKSVTVALDGLTASQVVEQINAQASVDGVPLKASLVQVAAGQWSMVVAGTETGISNTITATGTVTAPKLDASVMQSVQSPRDAELYVDGLRVTSSSNKIENVVPGVVLQLRKPVDTTLASASSVMISVTQNSKDIHALAQAVVTSFNELMANYTALTKTSTDKAQRGPLSGDSTLAGIMNRTRSLLADGMKDASGNTFRFADMGIELKSDGTLQLNEANFASAMESGLAAKLASGMTIPLDTYLNKMVLSTGELGVKEKALADAQAELQKTRDNLADRLVVVESSLRTRYSALDSNLFKLNQINTSLKSALDGLTNNNKN